MQAHPALRRIFLGKLETQVEQVVAIEMEMVQQTARQNDKLQPHERRDPEVETSETEAEQGVLNNAGDGTTNCTANRQGRK